MVNVPDPRVVTIVIIASKRHFCRLILAAKRARRSPHVRPDVIAKAVERQTNGNPNHFFIIPPIMPGQGGVFSSVRTINVAGPSLISSTEPAESTSESLPLLSRDASFAEDDRQQVFTNVASMGIGDWHRHIAANHELVATFHKRPRKARRSQGANQVLALDRAECRLQATRRRRVPPAFAMRLGVCGRLRSSPLITGRRRP